MQNEVKHEEEKGGEEWGSVAFFSRQQLSMGIDPMFGGSLVQDQEVMELDAMKSLSTIAAATAEQDLAPMHLVVSQVER